MSNQSSTARQHSKPTTADESRARATQRAGETSKGEVPSQADDEDSSDADYADLPLDEVFDALRNSRRRQVLRYLRSAEGRVTLSDLAEHIAAIENDTTVQALNSQQRKRVYVGLYQSHLPKLDDLGVVAFNQSRGHVELGPRAAQLDRYLTIDDEAPDDRPWNHHYLGFLAISALALTLGAATGWSALRPPPGSSLPSPSAWADSPPSSRRGGTDRQLVVAPARTQPRMATCTVSMRRWRERSPSRFHQWLGTDSLIQPASHTKANPHHDESLLNGMARTSKVTQSYAGGCPR